VVKQVASSGSLINGNSVDSITTRPLITIAPEASIAECAALMLDRNIRRVVVAEAGEPIGIISEIDIFRHVVEQK
jgi:isocitrate dehydrogenase